MHADSHMRRDNSTQGSHAVGHARRCLIHGHWQSKEAVPSPGGLLHWGLLRSNSSLDYRIAMRCSDLVNGVEKEAWAADAERCHRHLHHPLDGTFDGVFADPSRPVVIHVLGDSVGGQLHDSLKRAQKVNPHLKGLSVMRNRDHYGRRGLAVIPSSVAGSRWVLDGVDWGPRASESRKLLLVGSGVWYNLKRPCSKGVAWDRKCTVIFYQGKYRNESLSPQQVFADLDHDQPHKAPYITTLHHGTYAWARRYLGTLTHAEYGKDLAFFLEALLSWRQSHPDVDVAWFESTPQHFLGATRPDRSRVEPTSGRGGSLRSLATRSVCSAEPWPPFLTTAEDSARFCNGSDAVMAASLAATGRLGLTAHDRQQPEQSDGGAAWRLCAQWLGNWRNVIANELVGRSGVPIVPLAAALQGRSKLHKGVHAEKHEGPAGAASASLPDCLHWCEISSATLFMAQASLNIGAALLSGAHTGHSSTRAPG
jgi:hypothetical protein